MAMVLQTPTPTLELTYSRHWNWAAASINNIHHCYSKFLLNYSKALCMYNVTVMHGVLVWMQ